MRNFRLPLAPARLTPDSNVSTTTTQKQSNPMIARCGFGRRLSDYLRPNSAEDAIFQSVGASRIGIVQRERCGALDTVADCNGSSSAPAFATGAVATLAALASGATGPDPRGR